MSMNNLSSNNNLQKTPAPGGPMSWVCPSDRQLMLRAMLGAGWSNRSRDPTTPMKIPTFPGREAPSNPSGADSPGAREAITEEEKRHIAEILKKAEQSKRMEHNRIENLKSRVQALKVQVRGDGYHTCLLCGEALSLFKRAAKCDICNHRFCDKCSAQHDSRSGVKVTLCRCCYEQREVWKRSGAWQNGDLELLTDPPSRSTSILSNSSSNKGGVVDPNALLGQTGWRRYRSIHGHTTVVKPGRTAVLSENADSDSESEFDANMMGESHTPPVQAPATDRIPRKFPVATSMTINTENSPASAPSSPTPSHRSLRQGGTFYSQFSSKTAVASNFFSYAASRIGWGGGQTEKPECYSPPPMSPPCQSTASSGSKDGAGVVEAQKPFALVHPRQNNLINQHPSARHQHQQEPDIVPKQPVPTFRQLFTSPSSDKMPPLDDCSSSINSVASPGSHIMPASASNRALSSPMAASSDAGWSNAARSTGQPSDDSATDDAQSTTSSSAINPSFSLTGQHSHHHASSSSSHHKLASSRPDLTSSSQVNADRMSMKSLKFSDHEDSVPQLAPSYDTTSVRSLDVHNSSSSRSKSNRPNTLQNATSGPIPHKRPEKQSSTTSSPCATTPSTLAPVLGSIDRRRLSADLGRLLDAPKSMHTSASSSKVALVIAASAASSYLAAPPTALGPLSNTTSRPTETNAPHKTSASEVSSPSSSLSSMSVSNSQRKLHQRDSGTAVPAESISDVDSDVAYQLPNGGPSIAITEPGNAPDGTLHFTLMYDTAASTLICRIISAKDLASKDMNGLSDPYVKIELLPDPSKASQVKTQVVKKCLNPTWDETVVYEGVLDEDMKAKTLRLQVLDKDPIGYDFIGETRTTLSCLPTDRLLSYNVVLKPAQKEPKLLSGAALLDVGRIRLTFLYNSAESVFSVSGLRLARLARAGKKSNKDPPSPIIQIRLLVPSAPAATQPAFQTAIQRRAVNCNFGSADTFREKISLKELAKRVVDISVWDGHINKADSLIGSVQFGITSHGHQLRHFYQAVKTTDIAHTRWHALMAPPSAGALSAGSANSATPSSPSPSRSASSASASASGTKR